MSLRPTNPDAPVTKTRMAAGCQIVDRRATMFADRMPLDHHLTGPLAIGDHAAMIIGVAGRNGAGKGEFVDFLEARSFTVYSLSDAIRHELTDRGLSETRERMIEVGQEMRR
jgi:hypothetical protein